jgi:hypothetical protein
MDSIETSLFAIAQPVAQVRGLYLSGDEAFPSVENAELGLISVPVCISFRFHCLIDRGTKLVHDV